MLNIKVSGARQLSYSVITTPELRSWFLCIELCLAPQIMHYACLLSTVKAAALLQDAGKQGELADLIP